MIRDFKKPDVKAPRCRPKAQKLVNKEFIKELAKKHPECKGMSTKQINDILALFHGKLWNHAVNNRDGVELPEGLGYIFVGTCSSAKKYNTDFGNSIRNDLRYRHKNYESDSYLAKIFYTNFASKYKFKNRELWMFKATRLFKRKVAKEYPEKWKMYIQVESGRMISKYLKSMGKNNFFKKRSENYELDESYNEFDLNY